MINNVMDFLWKIFAALSFDCFKNSPSSQRSSGKLSSSQAGSLESSSLTGSLSLGPDLPHCQCCISYEARLKRLSCGHLYCDPCTDQIVNLAFEDIEGLSDYPCPMCKSLRQLGDLGTPFGCQGTPSYGPNWNLQQQAVKEHGSRWG
ncbi:hypothetical protein DPEC_G00352230 [Dallia pectoralis]|uniref:Uncharacterized protein n=1 Tax=Dallia pectoralis TaxID=75939 RepID=A0ACC2F293_DALPE|nr:hypothetical protein DPEC_G00352230 [Dallia pectoralis]